MTPSLVVEASAVEIDEAVQIANSAQQRWNKINYHRRAELLHEVAQAMRQARPVVAEMLTREMGKTYKESADEVMWSGTAVDYYAEIARHELGKVLGPTVDGQFHFTTKEPLGVVVIILPFNYPLCPLCWQAAAALASGSAPRICCAPRMQTSPRWRDASALRPKAILRPYSASDAACRPSAIGGPVAGDSARAAGAWPGDCGRESAATARVPSRTSLVSVARPA